MDDEIIAALIGSANTGKTGSTSVALPAAQKIAHGSTGLTIAKLVEAKQKLDEKSVDPSITRYIVCSPKQISDLLNNTTVTSADFNTVRALATGQISDFVGFSFILEPLGSLELELQWSLGLHLHLRMFPGTTHFRLRIWKFLLLRSARSSLLSFLVLDVFLFRCFQLCQ